MGKILLVPAPRTAPPILLSAEGEAKIISTSAPSVFWPFYEQRLRLRKAFLYAVPVFTLTSASQALIASGRSASEIF
ncbi:MAG TPA: hypothetical protein VKB96_17965 [Gammaproteobacteria bacterium]|nr:hypothetical protein [Gammaproteobacteria bacterium]